DLSVVEKDGASAPSFSVILDMMSKQKNQYKPKYFWEGQYWHLSELAAKFDIPYPTLVGRINRGLNLEQAVNVPEPEKVLYRGEKYSYSALSRHPDCEVSEKTLKRRISQGMPV